MGKRVKRASGYFKKGPQRPKTDTGDQSWSQTEYKVEKTGCLWTKMVNFQSLKFSLSA